VVTNHSAIDYGAVAREASLIFDTRDAFGAAGVSDPKVTRL
jgi:hypothetical protein